MFEVLYQHAKFGWARILPLPGQPKTIFCPSVCLSFTLVNKKVIFAFTVPKSSTCFQHVPI